MKALHVRERETTDAMYCRFCGTELATHVIDAEQQTLTIGRDCLDRLMATATEAVRRQPIRRFAIGTKP